MSDIPEYTSWICCGRLHAEKADVPDGGFPPGMRWEDVPVNRTCADCGARKVDFEKMAFQRGTGVFKKIRGWS